MNILRVLSHGGIAVKIIYDNDISAVIRPDIKKVIKQAIKNQCPCGCDEIYVSVQEDKRIDVKCYDCGQSYLELEIQVDE